MMTASNQSLSDFEAQLDRHEKELVAQKYAIRAFLNAKHKVKDTKIYLQTLEKTESTIDAVLTSLLDVKSTPEFKKGAEKLCQRCRYLNNTYVRELHKTLADETARHRKDFIRNAGVFAGIIAGSVTAVAKGLGNHVLSVNEAAGTGGAIGLVVIFHKKIEDTLRAVGKALCSAPAQMKDSYTLLWTRETIKEKRLAFQEGAKSMTSAVSKKLSNPRKTARRLLHIRKKEL